MNARTITADKAKRLLLSDYWTNVAAEKEAGDAYYSVLTTDPRNRGRNRALTLCQNAVRASAEDIRDAGLLLLIGSEVV